MGREREWTRAEARLGRTLKGKWRLDRLVGVGGTAAVYAATHRTGARFAIKILRPELSRDVDVQRRFRREAYLANAVKHPGVVTINDDDADEDGTPFLVMELLDGRSVETLCSEAGGKLDAEFVRAIALAVLDVLQAAHAQGIVHRDIKPSNLFRLETGEFKVLDFGVAGSSRPAAGESVHTGDGTFLGTPGFMAPEQARSRWDEVDARTDIWAVGATMFRLLSGEPVHAAETPSEELGLAMTASARSLASVAPELPRELVYVVDRALAYRPSARFPSARAMRDALTGHDSAADGWSAPLPDDREDAAPPFTFLASLVDSTVADRVKPSPRAARARLPATARDASHFGMAAGLSLMLLSLVVLGWVALTPQRPPASAAFADVKRAPPTGVQAPFHDGSLGVAPANALPAAPRAGSAVSPLGQEASIPVAPSAAPRAPPLPRARTDAQRRPGTARTTSSAASGAEPRSVPVPTPAPTSDPFDRRL